MTQASVDLHHSTTGASLLAPLDRVADRQDWRNERVDLQQIHQFYSFSLQRRRHRYSNLLVSVLRAPAGERAQSSEFVAIVELYRQVLGAHGAVTVVPVRNAGSRQIEQRKTPVAAQRFEATETWLARSMQKILLATTTGLVLFSLAVALARYNVVRTGVVLPIWLAGLTLIGSALGFLARMRRMLAAGAASSFQRSE